MTVTLGKAFELPPFVVEGRASNVRQATELVADAIAGEIRRAISLAGTPNRVRAAKALNRGKRDGMLGRRPQRPARSPDSRASARAG